MQDFTATQHKSQLTDIAASRNTCCCTPLPGPHAGWVDLRWTLFFLQVVMMGFSMGGYVTAGFAAAHPDLVAGVVMGACCHDCHTFKWSIIGHLAEGVYAVCSDKTKSQVSGVAQLEQSLLHVYRPGPGHRVLLA